MGRCDANPPAAAASPRVLSRLALPHNLFVAQTKKRRKGGEALMYSFIIHTYLKYLLYPLLLLSKPTKI